MAPGPPMRKAGAHGSLSVSIARRRRETRERRGRVAAADSLKSETFCRDRKNVVNHTTEPTPAATPTPVFTPTAPEPLTTSLAHQAHANTTSKSSCSHDAIRGAMHDALSRFAHAVSWQTIAPRLAPPSTAMNHDLSNHRYPLYVRSTALPADREDTRLPCCPCAVW